MLRASISAWTEEFPSDNLHPPLDIDAQLPIWSVEEEPSGEIPIVAIVNINMIHISPWTACLGLIAGAKRVLPPGGILYLYGPYKQNAENTSPSNAAFDASLIMQNSEWGVRNLEDVVAVAEAENFTLEKIFPMPANNLSLVFKSHNGG
jgi:hypothetical protein